MAKLLPSPPHRLLRRGTFPDGRVYTIAAAEFVHVKQIRALNIEIFDEERVINTFSRDDLMMLLASVDRKPVGFKIGYRESRHTYYSAKGGVLPAYRRLGLARVMLDVMMEQVRDRGYRHFAYDTFPNKHPGMTTLGLHCGFRVVKADFNTVYNDFRLRLEKRLT
ncbi:MAG: GNAT family N-acetyltransferase [Bacteroidota bacterium]